MECKGNVLGAVAGEFKGDEVRGEGRAVEGELGHWNAVKGDGGDGGGDGGDVLGVGVAG